MSGFNPRDMSGMKDSALFFSLRVSTAAHLFLFFLIAGLAGLAVWAALGTVENWANGTAVLRPQAEIASVRNEVSGRVVAKQVEHGDSVEAGMVLWSIDAEVDTAQLQRLETDLARLSDRRTETAAVLAALESGLEPEDVIDAEPNAASVAISLSDVDAQRRLQLILLQNRRLRLAAQTASRALVREESAPASMQRADRIEDLRTGYQQAQIDHELFIPSEVVRLQDEVESLDAQIAGIEQELRSVSQRIASSTVVAPISGVVEFVDDFQLGEFVGAGELRSHIVPEGAEQFRLVVNVPEAEAGELDEGQTLSLRFAGFPVAEYGMLSGTVTYVPQDARATPTGERVFELRGTLDQMYLTDRSGTRFPLRPGMSAEARVITRELPVYQAALNALDIRL